MDDRVNETDRAGWQARLAQKGADLSGLREQALHNGRLRDELLAGLVARDDVYRYNSFLVLLGVAEEQPALLAEQWASLPALLDSDNAFHRSIAVQLLARLVPADKEGHLDRLFERYFDHLDDESVVVARQVAQNAGRIATARPDLQAAVVARLLAVESTHHTHSRKELLKADVVQSLGEIYGSSAANREEIVRFVRDQLEAGSPTTRKAAKAFLQKHGG